MAIKRLGVVVVLTALACLWLAPVSAMIGNKEHFVVDKIALAQMWRFGFEQGGSLDMTIQLTSSPSSRLTFFLCTPDEVDKFRYIRTSTLCGSASQRASICYMSKELNDTAPFVPQSLHHGSRTLNTLSVLASDPASLVQASSPKPTPNRSWRRAFELLYTRAKSILTPFYKRFQATPLTATATTPHMYTSSYSNAHTFVPGESWSQKLGRYLSYFTQSQSVPKSTPLDSLDSADSLASTRSFSTMVALDDNTHPLHPYEAVYSQSDSTDDVHDDPNVDAVNLMDRVHDRILDTLLYALGEDAAAATAAAAAPRYAQSVFARPETRIVLPQERAEYRTLAGDELPKVQFQVNSIPRSTRYSLIQLNCDQVKYRGYLSYIAVNPGGEYLSTTLIPYKTLYLVALLGWGLLAIGWSISWLRYLRWNTQAQMALTVPLVLRSLQSLFLLLYWRNASSTGTYDTALYWVSFLCSMLCKGSSMFVFLILAFGYGIFRSTLPTQVMRRILVTVGLYMLGWCLFNRAMALGLYIVAFSTFLAIELCVLGIVRIVRTVQDQLVLLQTIRIAPADTPLWPKILILARLRRLFVYLLADFFVPIWSEAFRQEGPWLGDVFDHLLHFLFMLYLCRGYMMVPFNPHLASLAKTFHLTLPAPSVTALLAALAPRVAPGAPLWSPGVPIDPPYGEQASGYTQTNGLRMSRAAAQANLSHQLYSVNYNNGLPNPVVVSDVVAPAGAGGPGAIDDPFLRDPTRFTALPPALSMILSDREALEFAPIILRNPCPCLDAHVQSGQPPESLPHGGGVCPKQALGSIFSVLLEDKPQATRAIDAVNPGSRQPSPVGPSSASTAAAASSAQDVGHDDIGMARSPRRWLGIGSSQPRYQRINDEGDQD